MGLIDEQRRLYEGLHSSLHRRLDRIENTLDGIEEIKAALARIEALLSGFRPPPERAEEDHSPF